MTAPRFLRAFDLPRRSFLNLLGLTLSAVAAKRLRAQAADLKPPLGDGKLRIIAFGAHPDDCEFSAGGTAAKWAAQGHHVKFVFCTNGDIGHWRMAGARWLDAARRRSDGALKSWGTTSRSWTSTTGN